MLPAAAVDLLQNGKLLEATGCKRCGNTGYDGRVGIYELLVVNDEARRAIMAGAGEDKLVAVARENGLRRLSEDGLAKVCTGRTTLQELLRVAGHIETSAGVPGSDSAADASPNVRPLIGRLAPPADTGFDVEAYEELLYRWLQPSDRGSPSAGRRVPPDLHTAGRK